MTAKFRTFDEFFLFYLRQHNNRANRMLHACGAVLGMLIAIAALLLHHPGFTLLWIPVAYAFAWVGHLVIERNRPATWGHPWWSFLSEFRMIALMMTGRLNSWMAKAEAAEARPQAAVAQD